MPRLMAHLRRLSYVAMLLFMCGAVSLPASVSCFCYDGLDSKGTGGTAYAYDRLGCVPTTTLRDDVVCRACFSYKGEWRDQSGLTYLRNRYLDPTLGRFTQVDPSGAEENQFAYCGGDPVNRMDPMGLAFYAFDGTANHYLNPADHGGTNVYVMYALTRKSGSYNKHYYAGVGNPIEWGWRNGGNSRSSITAGQGAGAGTDTILDAAMADFAQDVQNNDKRVDVVGFSRGSAEALEFLHRIHDYVQDHFLTGIQINFVGLFDTVGSYGAHLGGDVDARRADTGGYRLSLTTGAFKPAHAFHAVALDEERAEFQGVDVQGAIQQGFRGVHSDIGGGYKKKGLSNIALHWMIDNAINSGVPMDTLQQAIAGDQTSWLNAYLPTDPNMLPHRELVSAPSFGMTHTYEPRPRVLPKGLIYPPDYTGPPKLDFHYKDPSIWSWYLTPWRNSDYYTQWTYHDNNYTHDDE